MIWIFPALVFIVLYTARKQPLLVLRLSLLSAPGLLFSIALSNDFAISLHLRMAQTEELYRKAIFLNGLALLTARIGWSVGAYLARKQRQDSVLVLTDVGIRNGIIVVTVAIIILFAQTRGGTIFNEGYGTRDIIGIPLGNINSIINILIAVIVYYMATNRHKNIWRVIVLILIVKIIYANVLRGIRADALDTLITIYIVLGVYYREYAVVRFRHLLAGIIFLGALYIVGIVRSSFVSQGWEGLDQYSFLNVSEQATTLHISTLSNIAATFTGLIWLADTGYELEWSRTYLGYILRVPPQFMYPDRPADLSWLFSEVGLTSGGGTFEVGEAYLTWGIPGVAIVPAVISAMMGYLIHRLRSAPNSIVAFMFLSAFVAVFSRGAWYQSFAYFKSFVTVLILLIPLSIVAQRRSVNWQYNTWVRGDVYGKSAHEISSGDSSIGGDRPSITGRNRYIRSRN